MNCKSRYITNGFMFLSLLFWGGSNIGCSSTPKLKSIEHNRIYIDKRNFVRESGHNKIQPNGKYKIFIKKKVIYKDIKYFAYLDGNTVLLDKNNRIIISSLRVYPQALIYSPICANSGKDAAKKRERERHPPKAKKNGLVGYVNITPVKYKSLGAFDKTLSRFELPDGRKGYIDKRGKEYYD